MLKNYKTLFFLVLALLSSSSLLAQQLPQVNYQGVARKADGSPVMNQSITLRLTIHDGSATGTSVYSEARQLTTNKFGLFTTVIGSAGALAQSGTMAGINWSTGNKFLQVEIDPSGGSSFVNMGTTQLQSVPYAIYAGSAAPGGAAGGDLSGSYPNPAVSKLQGKDVSNAAPTTGQVLKWNGTTWIPSDEEGAVGALSGNLPISAATVGRNSAISITKADAGTDGYLSKADWLIFNGKASITYVDGALALNSNALATEKARSTAAENALTSGLATEVTRATAAEATKEILANKSTNMVTDATSDIKYPSAKAVKTYVDASATSGSTALAAEVSRATAAEGVLTTALATEITRAKSEETAIQADLKLKATLASPTFSGTVSGVTSAMVGLGNVDNTTDLNKPISTATQSALNLKGSASDLALKAPLASPTFSGTVSGITASMVGLGNVTNTSDANKPISTATQTALDAKAPLASPTLTGIPLAPTATAGTNTTQVATTAFVTSAVATATVSGLDGLSDAKVGGTNFTNSLLLGHQTTGIINSAEKNIGIGFETFNALTDGDDNIGVGYKALKANTTGVRNVAMGTEAMLANTIGFDNAAVGFRALPGNTDGDYNAAFGPYTLHANTTGNQNAAFGHQALYFNSTGSFNTAMGIYALEATTGSGNVAVGNLSASHNTTGVNIVALGYRSALTNTTGTNNTIIGSYANVGSAALTNATALGYSAVVDASNTIQLGNANVTNVKTSGSITAGTVTYPKTDGTIGQVLSTNGSGTLAWSTPSIVSTVKEVADEFTATAAQTTFTLTQTKSDNSTIKMYINGIRISNTAYSVTGTELTYDASHNGAYALVVGDRIQFDYYYN